jgi:hypothetical protein
MNDLIHRAPSIGGVLNKILAINPELTATEAIDLVRQSLEKRGEAGGEFSQAEIINEDKALGLARSSIKARRN